MTDDVTLDPAMAAALERANELNARFPVPDNLEEERRRDQFIAAAWATNMADVGAVDPVSIPTEGGHKPALLMRPAGVERPPLMVLIHGGGWARGSIGQTLWTQTALCAASGHAVLSVSYRLAPEHPFPAGLNDVAAAYDWGLDNRNALGLSDAAPAVGGLSAGANLSLALTVQRRRQGKPLPAGLVLFYGVFGDDLDTASYQAFGDGRFGLSRARMAESFENYVGIDGDRTDPLVSPIHADLAGLPPAWLSTAEADVLRDDSLAMAEKMTAAGVSCTLVRGHGLVHGYCNRGAMVPRAVDIVRQAGAFLADLGLAR